MQIESHGSGRTKTHEALDLTTFQDAHAGRRFGSLPQQHLSSHTAIDPDIRPPLYDPIAQESSMHDA